MNEAHSGGSISASRGPPARVICRLGIPNYRVGGALRCRSRGARVKPGCMCAEKRLGRARLRLRMSLSGFRLRHSPRGGCAARETEAVAGATHLFRCLAWHRGGLGCARHPTSLGGRSESAIPSGKANRRTGASRSGLLALARGPRRWNRSPRPGNGANTASRRP